MTILTQTDLCSAFYKPLFLCDGQILKILTGKFIPTTLVMAIMIKVRFIQEFIKSHIAVNLGYSGIFFFLYICTYICVSEYS
jgi:hypothetical protein